MFVAADNAIELPINRAGLDGRLGNEARFPGFS
jgi:hypothetical protein